MATMNFGPAGYDLSTTVDELSEFTDVGVFMLAATAVSGDTYILGGAGFAFTNGEPSGGTINTYQENSPTDAEMFAISGLDITLVSYLNYVDTGNLAGLKQAAFAGNDTFLGNTGNDVFIQTGGNDRISGAGGFNIYDASSDASSYTVTRTGEDAFTVHKPAGGADTVTGVQELVFADNSAIGFDLAGVSGQVYRLYQAAFDRAPDPVGLGYWINAGDNGMSLVTMAASFEASAEFSAKYGALDTAGFVSQLYANVLHRAADPGGAAYWAQVIGSNAASEPQVLADFSESAENQANVLGQISNGVHYTHWLG